MLRDNSISSLDSLENGRYNFAMYMAGAVGSMGPIEKGTEILQAENLADRHFSDLRQWQLRQDVTEGRIIELR